MKFEEALAAMREGKKIGRAEGDYIQISDGEIVDSDYVQVRFTCTEILAEDWEILPEKWEPEGGDWVIDDEGDVTKSSYHGNINFGNSRKNKGSAERARDKMRVFNRILAYVDEHAPGWEPDWSDPEKNKWYVIYSYDRKMFMAVFNSTCKCISSVYMPEDVAKKLCEELNSGRVEL